VSFHLPECSDAGSRHQPNDRPLIYSSTRLETVLKKNSPRPRCQPNDHPLSAHPLAPKPFKKNSSHRSAATTLHDRAPPCRLGNRALHRASLSIVPPLCWLASPPCPSAATDLPPSPLHLLPAVAFSTGAMSSAPLASSAPENSTCRRASICKQQ
jgi:hypothetical protein